MSAAARAAIYHADADDDGAGALTRDVFVEPLERLLLDGAADGTLRAVDASEMATVVFNVIGHTYTHLRADHRWDPERARGGVMGLVLDGLVAGGGGESGAPGDPRWSLVSPRCVSGRPAQTTASRRGWAGARRGR